MPPYLKGGGEKVLEGSCFPKKVGRNFFGSRNSWWIFFSGNCWSTWCEFLFQSSVDQVQSKPGRNLEFFVLALLMKGPIELFRSHVLGILDRGSLNVSPILGGSNLMQMYGNFQEFPRK